MMQTQRKNLVLGMLLVVAIMAPAGCQSPPWTGVDMVPDMEPQIAGLVPQLARAQALNHAARRQVRQLTPADVPVQKPRVLATLAVQRRALYRAAATVAVVRTAAGREDQAARRALAAARHAAAELTATHELLQQAQQRYHNAWLGGKAHRLIDWIVGFSVAAVVLDFLADAFLGVGFNPLEWIAGLSGLAKKKLA
ncbi:MAG: hypothetical protein HKL95_05855 [Phycisphaerae bacterium]|nr:hypothetical protein [Phycisphaerae bacterium]